MAEKLKEVKISRKKWHRNEGNSHDFESLLRMPNGKQCCMGFLARACGYRVKDIANRGYPSSLMDSHDRFSEELLRLEYQIAVVNDRSSVTIRKREQEIRVLFKKAGYKAVFVP